MESIEKEIVHFSHEHPLILQVNPPKITRDYNSDSDSDDSRVDDEKKSVVDVEDNNSDSDNDDSRVDDEKKSVVDMDDKRMCDGCGKTISSLGPYYYTCPSVDCDYDLHILCAKQPQKIDHHLHPQHPLTLYSNPVYDVFSNCCHRSPKHFTYHCEICNFNMDIICATIGDRKFDNRYHKHPLCLLRNPLSTVCNVCGIENKRKFYQCSVCINFWIHRDCALLPSRIMIQQTGRSNRHHPHPLTLTNLLANRYFRFEPTCKACRKPFNPSLSLYSCEGCRYFVHIGCTIIHKPFFPAKFQLAELKLNQEEEVGLENKDVDHDLLQLPYNDQSYSLLKELSIKLGIDLEENEVNDSVHHHIITLYSPLNNNANQSILHNPMKRTELICSSCVRPITKFPYYKCLEEECKDFVLHEWCARLPSELPRNLFHKKCSLTLFPVAPKFFGIFECGICGIHCNGFAYGCVDCNYYIDVRCALLPDSLKHEAHEEHIIVLRRSDMPNYVDCESCRNFFMKWGYFCETCNYKLCLNCVLFPKILRHKYDRHTLNLAYYPIQNHLSDYFCDICEEEMDPFAWFYHCIGCDQSFHTKCIRVSGGVKYGGILNVDYHPHPLQHAEWFKETKMRCVECDNETNIGFRCVECNYAIHHYCVLRRGP